MGIKIGPAFVGDGPGGLGQGRMSVAAGPHRLGAALQVEGQEASLISHAGLSEGPGPSLGGTHRTVGGVSEQSRPGGCRGRRGLSGALGFLSRHPGRVSVPST